jgi:hypothetical protein
MSDSWLDLGKCATDSDPIVDVKYLSYRSGNVE